MLFPRKDHTGKTQAIAQAVDRGRQKEKNRIISFSKEYLRVVGYSDETIAEFSELIERDITAEQLKILDLKAGDPMAKRKAEMLDAIKRAGAENPGMGGNGERPGSGKDFMAQVEAYSIVNGCKKSDAIFEVRKQNPDAFNSWLAKQQPNRAN